MVRLRPMRPADLDELMPHERDMFGTESWSRASYEDELADTDLRYYLVAERDGRVVGSGGLLTVGGTAEVLTVGVLPEMRRQGIGEQLMAGLLAEARRRAASEVLLEVRMDNDSARKLYEKLGFAVIGIRRGYYDLGRVDALTMRLPLDGSA